MWKLVRGLIVLALAVTGLVAVQVAEAPPAAAAVSSKGCNPGVTSWTLEGAFSDGAVMESRACLRYDSASHDAKSYVEWRIRKGGSAVQGIWDMDSLYGDGAVVSRIYRQSPEPAPVIISSFGYSDDVSASYVVTDTIWDCDSEHSLGGYNAYAGYIRVYNPGTGTKSGFKTQTSYTVNGLDIDCFH